MINLLMRSLLALLLEGIKAELSRIGRDITEQDNLEFFEYPERERDFATHITLDGKVMASQEEIASLDDHADLGLDVEALNTMYEQLKAIDDDQEGLVSVGSALLGTLGLQGRDVVDVTIEDRILIGTSDGKVFSFKAFEVGENGEENLQSGIVLDPAAEVDDDKAQSEGEGWLLSACHGGKYAGLYQIQRDDDANVFIDDDEALLYVTEMAEQGSELHRRALNAHLTPFRTT